MDKKWVPEWVSEIHQIAIENGWEDEGDMLENDMVEDSEEGEEGMSIYIYKKGKEKLMLGIESFIQYGWINVYFDSQGPMRYEYYDDEESVYSISKVIVSKKEFLEKVFSNLRK